jgi:hypothetical protein
MFLRRAEQGKEQDDMAFLRSDSDDEGPPLARPGSSSNRQHGGELVSEGSMSSHPSRSRFFDAPSSGMPGGPPPPPPPPPPQQQQPGTPSGDPSVVGRKLTFDQFKMAAAGAASGGGMPHHPQHGPPPPHMGGGGGGQRPGGYGGPPHMEPPGMPQGPPPPGTGGQVLTMAELENKMGGGPGPSRLPPGMPPPGMPPPPGMGFPPPPAGVCRACGLQRAAGMHICQPSLTPAVRPLLLLHSIPARWPTGWPSRRP